MCVSILRPTQRLHHCPSWELPVIKTGNLFYTSTNRKHLWFSQQLLIWWTNPPCIFTCCIKSAPKIMKPNGEFTSTPFPFTFGIFKSLPLLLRLVKWASIVKPKFSCNCYVTPPSSPNFLNKPRSLSLPLYLFEIRCHLFFLLWVNYSVKAYFFSLYEPRDPFTVLLYAAHGVHLTCLRGLLIDFAFICQSACLLKKKITFPLFHFLWKDLFISFRLKALENPSWEGKTWHACTVGW